VHQMIFFNEITYPSPLQSETSCSYKYLTE
jgi:hypothetical protein